MNKVKKINMIFKNIIFILQFLFKYVPVYVIITIVIYIAKGMLQSLSNVWLVEKVIDSIVNGTSFISLIIPVLMFCLYALLVGLFNAIYLEIIEKLYQQKFSDSIRMEIYNKAISCDIACYDNSEFYNNFIWAIKEIDKKAFSILQSLAMYIQRITVISSTIFMLAKINSIIIIVVLLSCTLNCFFTLKQNKLQFELKKKENNLSKKKNYVSRTFISVDYAKEFRTSKISTVLFNLFNETNNEMEENIKNYSKQIWKYDFLKKLIGEDIIVSFTSIIILSLQVIHGAISLGAFMSSYKGMQIIYSSLSFLLGKASTFLEASLYIEKFKKFWYYKPLILSIPNALIPNDMTSIAFKNVYFSYENLQNNILENISIDFTKHQKIAIVGSNGAGKTTLIKLLLRLYDVQNGSIAYNGTNIKELNLDAYRKHYSCLFQDFNLYAATLNENIAMDLYQKSDKQKVCDVIAKSGFQSKFESLQNGLDTIITREFDSNGILLSGGEKQKVAIARVLYQNADCLILDEPTAALDPIAEKEFNNIIIKNSSNKLMIVISHRLTTTRFMDKILVLDNGKIIESGSHNELMSLDGKYAKLYSLQASQYNEIEW